MTTPGVAEQSSPSSSSTIEQKLKEMFTHLENGFNQTALLRGEPTRAQAIETVDEYNGGWEEIN